MEHGHVRADSYLPKRGPMLNLPVLGRLQCPLRGRGSNGVGTPSRACKTLADEQAAVG
ncbi:hypothetical protein ACWFQ8_25385 [Streptomyces sp. NPDC055254]